MSTAVPHSSPKEQEPPRGRYANESLLLLAVILVVGIFATTLPQPQVLGKIPLQNILKNQLHVPRSETARFFFLCGIFWYLKPIAGILTDAFPIFKTRRRHYLLISSVCAGLSWVALGFVPKTYSALLWASIVVNLFMVMMSTVIGAFLVEVGQSRGATGRLTAVRQFTMALCTLIQGPLGGFFASGALLIAAGANAALVISIFPVAYLLMKEKPEAMRNASAFTNARGQLAIIGRSKPFWLSIVFIGLFYFAPGFSTLLYYRQNDTMKLGQEQIGLLSSMGGFGGILAALAYGAVARKFPLRWMILFGVVTAASGTLLYLFYNSYPVAFAVDFQNGLFFGFAEVSLIDLAARGTPAGCEGLGYSLMMSMRNVSLFGADWLGSMLADKQHWSWSTMVGLNAASTAIVLLLLPFMPSRLVGSRDGGTPPS